MVCLPVGDIIHSLNIVDCLLIMNIWSKCIVLVHSLPLTLLHSERPNLYTILAFLSAVGLSAHTYALDSAEVTEEWKIIAF